MNFSTVAYRFCLEEPFSSVCCLSVIVFVSRGISTGADDVRTYLTGTPSSEKFPLFCFCIPACVSSTWNLERIHVCTRHAGLSNSDLRSTNKTIASKQSTIIIHHRSTPSLQIVVTKSAIAATVVVAIAVLVVAVEVALEDFTSLGDHLLASTIGRRKHGSTNLLSEQEKVD